jgi:hypothetical protein
MLFIQKQHIFLLTNICVCVNLFDGFNHIIDAGKYLVLSNQKTYYINNCIGMKQLPCILLYIKRLLIFLFRYDGIVFISLLKTFMQ